MKQTELHIKIWKNLKNVPDQQEEKMSNCLFYTHENGNKIQLQYEAFSLWRVVEDEGERRGCEERIRRQKSCNGWWAVTDGYTITFCMRYRYLLSVPSILAVYSRPFIYVLRAPCHVIPRASQTALRTMRSSNCKEKTHVSSLHYLQVVP